MKLPEGVIHIPPLTPDRERYLYDPMYHAAVHLVAHWLLRVLTANGRARWYTEL